MRDNFTPVARMQLASIVLGLSLPYSIYTFEIFKENKENGVYLLVKIVT